MKLVFRILDPINQYFCNHEEKFVTMQEISRARAGGKTYSVSWYWNITMECYCNKCGKKWNKIINK